MYTPSKTIPRSPAGGHWPVCGLASLLLHCLFGVLFAALFGSMAVPPPAAPRDAVAVTLVEAPKPPPAAVRPAPDPAPARVKPRERGPATGNLRSNARDAKRDGTGATEGRPGPVGPKAAELPQTGGGGGSPAPSKDLTGSGGAKGAVQPIEDVLFSGGGRGGAELPKVAPRAGGGAGNTPVPTEATPRLDLPAPEPTPLPDTVRAPVAGAGNVRDGSAGVGFRSGEGIGTAPRGPVARGTLRSAPDGSGIGAAADGRNTGTRSPGGGIGEVFDADAP
ncbi:MAG TPA: hypothetical protein VM490_21745, partial [Armatimonadaceae bacterium]|nr:hypothetical protein [Armatimonadaceae bacterium]